MSRVRLLSAAGCGPSSCPGTPLPSGTDNPGNYRSEVLREPAPELLNHTADIAGSRTRVTRTASRPRAVQEQAHAGRMQFAGNDITQARDVLRHADADHLVEDLFRQLQGAFHARGTSGQHDAGSDEAFVSRAAQFVLHHLENLLVAGLYRLRER